MITISRTDKGQIRIEIEEDSGDNAVEYLSNYDAKEVAKEILDAMIKEWD